ncbi:MAG: hypothetical protein WA159_15015 [Variovorax sp.]
MNTIAFARRSAGTLAFALTVGLAGCQSMPAGNIGAPEGPHSAAELRLQQSEKRVRETVYAAALTGALWGVPIGMAVKWATGRRTTKDLVDGAKQGMLFGGSIAAIDGYVTAKKEQAGKEHIAVTEAAARDLRKENANLQDYVANAVRVAAEGRARLGSLAQDIASRKLGADEARRAREREERNLRSMEDALAEARTTRTQYAGAVVKLRTSEPTGNLDGEIQRLDQQIGQLQSTVSAYRRALEVSRA